MGAPKPWPTRWPAPERLEPDPEWIDVDDDLPDPDYVIEAEPEEAPHPLPEERLHPYAVTWGITPRCNLRCQHCYDAADRQRRVLTTSQAIEVIDRLAAMGITMIAFSGGEPLMRPDLFELMAHCRAQHFDIALRSNATLITPEAAHKMADLDVCVAGVSLDGATEATHNAVRGAGAYRKLRAGIDALLAADIRVNVEVVLSQHNAAQALDFVTLAERWGVDEVNFSALAPAGRARRLKDAVLEPRTRQALITQLSAMSEIAQVDVSPSCALVGSCWACVEPNITCDGYVTPCYLSSRRLFSILAVDPAEARTRLAQARPTMRYNCSRIGAPVRNDLFPIELLTHLK